MKRFKKGDSVAWNWGNGQGKGTIQDICYEQTAIESKGKTIIRDGSNENPAVIIKDSSGTNVLKRANELNKEN